MHLKTLHMVSRMVNTTVLSMAKAMDAVQNERAYRGWLNDLVLEGLLYKKAIVDGDSETKSGRPVGTLFALTQRGAETVAEMVELPESGIYFYKEGIKAKSPFGYTHRALLIEIIAEFFRLESQGKLEILEMLPDFQKEGSSRLGTSRAVSQVKIDSGFIIPDALLKIRIGEKVRIIALELHRTTSTTHINEQLMNHAEAMEKHLFSDFFGVETSSFVLSVHARETTLVNTLKIINEGRFPDFGLYSNGYHFTTVEDVRKKGIVGAFYHADGERSKLFNV